MGGIPPSAIWPIFKARATSILRSVREEQATQKIGQSAIGPLGWLEKGPAASLLVRYGSQRIRSSLTLSVLSPKYEVFCCDQNGPPARREEGAYLKRYVTDEQRGRRPIFIATLWAGASWLFFRVARSTRMTKIWALRSRLEKRPTDLRQNTSYFGDRTLVETPFRASGDRTKNPRSTLV